MIKRCSMCGSEFETNIKIKKVCSKECRLEYIKKYAKDKRAFYKSKLDDIGNMDIDITNDVTPIPITKYVGESTKQYIFSRMDKANIKPLIKKETIEFKFNNNRTYKIRHYSLKDFEVALSHIWNRYRETRIHTFLDSYNQFKGVYFNIRGQVC